MILEMLFFIYSSSKFPPLYHKSLFFLRERGCLFRGFGGWIWGFVQRGLYDYFLTIKLVILGNLYFSAWDYRNFFTGVYQTAPEVLPGLPFSRGHPTHPLSLKSCIKQLLGHGKIGFWA